jgi:hypothetical protein
VATGANVLAAGKVINGPITNLKLRPSEVITGTSPSFQISLYAIMSRLSG